MGTANPVVVRVETPCYGRVIVDASDGQRYHADLSSFSSVRCFPTTTKEWAKVSRDSYGLGLVWASRFEVHIDQIVGLADSATDAHRPAAP